MAKQHVDVRVDHAKGVRFACVDGLKGFPDAIAVEYPQTRIQLCLVHMVRNSLRYVSWKDCRQKQARGSPACHDNAANYDGNACVSAGNTGCGRSSISALGAQSARLKTSSRA